MPACAAARACPHTRAELPGAERRERQDLAVVLRGRAVCNRDEYDNCMKRITVSLPDELVDKIKRAAGGKRQVSSYVATALEEYQERENLDDILAAWRAETPVPEEVQRQVEAELDHAGLTGPPRSGDRLAGGKRLRRPGSRSIPGGFVRSTTLGRPWACRDEWTRRRGAGGLSA